MPKVMRVFRTESAATGSVESDRTEMTNGSVTSFRVMYRAALVLSACVLLLTVNQNSSGQRPQSRPKAIDYSKFSHSTKKHQAACNTCHEVPSTGWQKSSTYPDINDYPGHDACVGCHRPQFFKGQRPPICSVCHVRTSPRDQARLAFRNPASKLQFTIEFPHDKHQDVIALFLTTPNATTAFAHPRRAFDDKTLTYYNCSLCHSPSSPAKSRREDWPDAFQPTLATFKSVPSGHDACFNCHWKAQQPIATNCAGCHKLAATPYSISAPERISLKFMHDGGGEKKVHVAECTTCHINITKSVSLRGLKPDVPITSCTECHNKEGIRQDVSKELAAIDKNRDFVCVYCHTSNVGKLDAPPSHYLISERPPVKRKEIK